MPGLKVSLFGKLEVWSDEQVVVGLEGHKAQELFCYLLLNGERPHPREALADLLWGDSSTTQSKGYLRKTLWQIQTALEGPDRCRDTRLFVVEPDWVQLDPEADLWLDVAEFERAFSLAQGVRGEDLGPPHVTALQDAVDLYQGDLLEGWYQDWCLYERERLQHMYLIMLDKLMGSCEARCEWEAGLIYGTCILRFDRARERTHRRLMRLYYLAGDRTSALRQYERCVAALSEELGVAPAKRTVALHRQIQIDQFTASPGVMLEAPEMIAASASPLRQVLGYLKHLQGLLDEFQHRVQHDIQELEQTLDKP